MVPILDWIFEGIVGWVASIISQLFDAVSGLFLEALGTDMTAMEEYFPFVEKAYDVMQVTAYAILILIVIWQLFRAFGGPITEAENPWHLVVRGALFAFLIGNAKPIFATCLTIARAPYTSLMELSMSGEDFTFAGVEHQKKTFKRNKKAYQRFSEHVGFIPLVMVSPSDGELILGGSDELG